MCGIVGYAGLSPAPEQFRDAMNSLSHRGPDMQNQWVTDTFALGHTRLAIMDLSEKGTQPLRNETGTVRVIANGELYNFAGMRSDLQANGHHFVSTSDSEVLVHGYEEWGIAGLVERINGMYAFAIVDTATGHVYLVRDRVGIKPLYYWTDGRALAFASELQAIRKLVPALSISAVARESYFVFGYIPGTQTIYERCSKLLPGHYLSFRAGDLQTTRYWSCPLPEAAPTEPVTTETIHDMLKTAVRDRLVSERPLGVFLSGGIDSSLVAAIAAQELENVQTYAVGFDFAEYDERPHARAIARHLGCEHTDWLCSDTEALELIPTLPAMYGEPFADASALPTALLCRKTREHVVVALSGDGGDELCLGYNRYRDAAKISALVGTPGRKQIGKLGMHVFAEDRFAGKLAKSLTVASRAEACLLAGGIFHKLFYDRLRAGQWPIETSYWQHLFDQTGDLPLNLAWAWVDMQHYMVEDILTKVDRASMRTALEVRVPLLDYRLIERFASVPVRQKSSGGRTKILLREILSDYVPATLWDRAKHGFGAPVDKWLRGPLNPMLHDLLDPVRLKDEGLFDVPFVTHLIHDHENHVKDNQYYLWTLLMWELWRSEFGH